MHGGEHWIFGYGSLVWRPAFVYEESAPGRIHGFARRFWQGSPDHRGAPESPGRVVTLVSDPAARCAGIAYRISPAAWSAVLEQLDARESGGFERRAVTVHFHDTARGSAAGWVYMAVAGNPNYLGPAPPDEIASQIRRSSGRSGTNVDYVLQLAQSLRELGVEDPHVAEIAELLRAG